MGTSVGKSVGWLDKETPPMPLGMKVSGSFGFWSLQRTQITRTMIGQRWPSKARSWPAALPFRKDTGTQHTKLSIFTLRNVIPQNRKHSLTERVISTVLSFSIEIFHQRLAGGISEDTWKKPFPVESRGAAFLTGKILLPTPPPIFLWGQLKEQAKIL